MPDGIPVDDTATAPDEHKTKRKRTPRPLQAGEGQAVATTRQMATKLAVSEKTIKRLAADNALPGICRIGRSLRFNLDAVQKWLNAGCPKVR
jgi:excisionase family DNA binding protein